MLDMFCANVFTAQLQQLYQGSSLAAIASAQCSVSVVLCYILIVSQMQEAYIWS